LTTVPEAVGAADSWPSIDVAQPTEEGGPIARTGFNYQDEIAVSFLIDMLTKPTLVKVHLETHDDIVLVWAEGDHKSAEYVQVKASQVDQFWSIAELCQRNKSQAGTSIFEKSLSRDGYEERSLFRLVTLRPVVSALLPLTWPRSSQARTVNSADVIKLVGDIDKRCPGFKSPKGSDHSFWVSNCLWDHRDSEGAIAKDNLLRLMRLAHEQGRSILFEPAETLLLELRAKAKEAGGAKWLPDPSKKIIAREHICAWWETRVTALLEGASSPSGGKLVEKMVEAGLTDEVAALATELRRRYAAEMRASRYLEPNDAARLQRRVLSEVATLRARFVSREIDLSAAAFHALCISQMDAINAERADGREDQAAFLKGCLYDVADRCQLRFVRPG